MCDKAILENGWTLKPVIKLLINVFLSLILFSTKTQEKLKNKNAIKTQEICDKIASDDPFTFHIVLITIKLKK